jgi:hypothetical protein
MERREGGREGSLLFRVVVVDEGRREMERVS